MNLCVYFSCRIEDGVILGSLKVHEDGDEDDTEDHATDMATHNLKFGDVCTAT